MKASVLFGLMAFFILQPIAFARNTAMTAALLRAQAVCMPLAAGWTPQWASIQGYWTLDDASGATTAVDSSPNGSNGTAANVTFATAGRMNNAASFNGTTSSIAATPANSAAYTATDSSYTMAAWIKITSLPPVNCTTNSSTCKGMMFGRFNIGMIITNAGAFEVDYYTGTGTWHGVTAGSLSTGKWYHVAMVVDNVAKTTQPYINGVPSGAAQSFSGSSSYVYGTTAPYVIGMGDKTAPLTNGSTAHPFNGIVDEAAIWNTALTAAEVRTIYDQQSCGKN